MSIESNVCDAIELLVDNAVAKAQYDKTIQGTVIKCIDATIGKYLIKYQDSTFNAYASGSGVSYPDGTGVYILVPGNDMSRDKTIIGASEKTAINYIEPEAGEDAYTIVGTQFVEKAEQDFGLRSRYSEKIIIYDKDDEDHKDITFNETQLKRYIQQSDTIVCGASFKTSLAPEQRMNGNYGIIFKLNFNDNATGSLVEREYIVDINSMTGNPYNLKLFMRQYEIFEVDGANFDSISSISLFVEGFPNQVKTEDINDDFPPVDIFVNNIEICGALALTAEEREGYSLSLETPQGSYFETAEKTQYKTIVATVKVKGLPVDSSSQNIAFYWFREDARVTPSHEAYNPYGGTGWRCMNDSYDTAAGEGQITIKEWVPATDTLLVLDDQLIAHDNKIKCVAVYESITVSKEIIIQNLGAETPKIVLESDSGVDFYYDNGKPILTCRIYNRDLTEEKDPNDYEFYWSYENNKGKTASIDNAANTYTVNIPEITFFNIYRCSVYHKDSDTYQGTASIKITNKLLTEGNYSLLINGGSQVFTYNENGVSPTSKSLDYPIELEPLSFTLYDNGGNEISEEVLKTCPIEWIVPHKDTMIVAPIKDSFGNDIVAVDTGEDYIYKNLTVLPFDIVSQYSYDDLNNQIQLVVNYKDLNITAETNFSFLKQGDPGTNGTEYSCRIVPNTTGSIPNYITITTNTENNSYFNFTNGDKFVSIGSYNELDPDNSNSDSAAVNPFNVELYENGKLIFSNHTNGYLDEDKKDLVNVEWEIFANQYGVNKSVNQLITDESNLKIVSKVIPGKNTFDHYFYFTPGFMSTASDPAPANIIRAIVTYKDQVLYAVLPISTIKLYTDIVAEIPDKTGYQHVVYTSSGAQPKYARRPFEVRLLDSNGGDVTNGTTDIIYNFNWTPRGSVKEYKNSKYITQASISLKETSAYLATEQDKYRQEFTPEDRYNGLCVTNSVYVEVKDQNDESIADINIPVYLYLNRYGLENINAWDGNSVQVNAEGGFILSPQIGAGVKNEDNSFTGLLMGQVLEPNRTSSDIGLLGYNKGIRTIFLDSETGGAQLGSGTGQLVIDPNTNGRALLYSRTYWKEYTEKGYPAIDGDEEANINRSQYSEVKSDDDLKDSNARYFILSTDNEYIEITKEQIASDYMYTTYVLDNINGAYVYDSDNRTYTYYEYYSANDIDINSENITILTKDRYKKEYYKLNPPIYYDITDKQVVLRGSYNDDTGEFSVNNTGIDFYIKVSAEYRRNLKRYNLVEGVYQEQSDGNYIRLEYQKETRNRYTQLKENVYKLIANTGEGMLIDLTTPKIDFASGNFSVNEKGEITAKAGTVGGWQITNNTIQSVRTIQNSNEPYSLLRADGYIRLGYLGGQGLVEVAGFNIQSGINQEEKVNNGNLIPGTTDIDVNFEIDNPVNGDLDGNKESEEQKKLTAVLNSTTESTFATITFQNKILNGNHLHFLYNNVGMQLFVGKQKNDSFNSIILSPKKNINNGDDGYLINWKLTNIPSIEADNIYKLENSQYEEVATRLWTTNQISAVKESLLTAIKNVKAKYSVHAHSWSFDYSDDNGNVTGKMTGGGTNGGTRAGGFNIGDTGFYKRAAFNYVGYGTESRYPKLQTVYSPFTIRDQNSKLYLYVYNKEDQPKPIREIKIPLDARQVYLAGVEEGAKQAAALLNGENNS